jgi:hypothetical protein
VERRRLRSDIGYEFGRARIEIERVAIAFTERNGQPHALAGFGVEGQAWPRSEPL